MELTEEVLDKLEQLHPGVENPQNSPPTARYGVTWHAAAGRPPMITWHVRR